MLKKMSTMYADNLFKKMFQGLFEKKVQYVTYILMDSML